MKKGFYMIASNNGIMEPESGTFELHYPLIVNRRETARLSSHSWMVTHIQTGRSISGGLTLKAARSLAKAIKGLKVWESQTVEAIHEHLASETQENKLLMKERNKASAW
jgi:hypothetical protein